MASNIKIIGNILSTSVVSRYDEKDNVLITSRNIQEYFGGENDYIEYYLYDAGSNILRVEYNYLRYKLPPSSGLKPGVSYPPNTTGNIQTENVGIDSTLAPQNDSLYPLIEIDPVQDIQYYGYSSGEFIVKYNFFQNKLSNFFDRALFIKEISNDRKEVRLASATLTNDEIESVALSMIEEINNSSYYVDYLLNFGNNKQYLAVNVALNKAVEGYEVLFKLYKPLPLDIQEKATLWVVSEKASPYSFDINLDRVVTPPPPPTLRGPNFDIPVLEGGTIATSYTNYQTAVNTLQNLQSSSYNYLQNLLNTQSIQINVNYKISESVDFGNFTFFGSAYQRIANFYTKIKQIEDYNILISKYKPNVTTTSSLQTEINLYSSSISTLISQFDGYESYLYFESSSYTFPKSGSFKPYKLFSTSSTQVVNWYATQSLLAQEYDVNNYNNLIYTVPDFILNNEDNQPYLLFLNMVGQYFDNIWIYLKAITDVNLANNNLNYGISKDLVYEQLKSLGIKLYNSQAGEALDTFLIGANTGSTTWNNDFSPTSSYLNNIPRKDLVSELYKRIYHNLPLLLKQKGTVEGLNSLMTIFGIPNKTYYTVGSGSFYTPTGSNLTASILNVKEYGGSLKSNLIKGYNNDKVRIVSNEIVTGSVLSPIASLQTYPTASSQFRDDDLQFIDISFTPQTQINTYISGAISSNNSTWNIDDYIGDPKYLYSSSYTPLDQQRKLYYQTGVTGYAPFTASALDYNGFIRLIEFFDNSLFKMLGDFVPERTSVSTGITFESPVLERNKTPYSQPSTYTGSVYEVEIDSVDMSSDYGDFYDALGNDKKAWYDGNISGSIINIYDYFENDFNSYLLSPSSSFTTSSIYQFQHSDFNVLLNNVSKGVSSIIRKDIEYVYGTTGSITYPAELQDSYLTLQSYNNSRYNGTKLTSLLYNTYTSASYTGSDGIFTQEGDISFGKTAVVDRHPRKIGLFTRIESSSFLPKRNTVALKYLVDEFGGLTELNQRNTNWADIQRTFLMGSRPNISLFDNKKYSNQKPTDGNKLVFDSGYTYAPILYFSTCSVQSCTSCGPSDLYLPFEGANNEPASYDASAKNSLTPNFYVSGSPSPHYSISASYIMNLFDSIVEGAQYLTTGSATTFPSYSVQETGDYNISIQIPASWTVTSPPAVSSSWHLEIWKRSGGTETFLARNSYTWLAGDPAEVDLTFSSAGYSRMFFTLSSPVLSQNITINGGYINAFDDNTCFNVSPLTPNNTGQLTVATMAAGSTIASVKNASTINLGLTHYQKDGTGLTINGTFVAWDSYITLASGCKVYARVNSPGCTAF